MRLADFAKLVWPNYNADWYHELMISQLELLAEGHPSVPNLLVAAPPGSGKTQLISILFPAWLFTFQPQSHVIALSNSDALARLASGNVLRLIQHPEFQARWPRKLSKTAEAQWSLDLPDGDGRPSMHAAGIGGQLTGHRADFLLWDDLIKSQSEAYSEVVRSRIMGNFSSAAETRLLPEGKIAGIQTRWHMDDPISRLLRRAEEEPNARQFVYLSLAAWNTGEDSYILDTRTGVKKYLPKYRALASKFGQKYSFTRRQLEGKRADLGPTRWSALYMQQPLSGEDQLFPETVWRTLEHIPVDEISLIITAWDCASKTGEKNDYSANVVVGRFNSGGFIVLDVWKSRLNFAQLPRVVLERYRFLVDRYRQLPVLCIEDANSGTQLIDLFHDQYPEIPVVRAKAVHAKVIRAEGVTPYTSAGLVSLPRDTEWREAFIRELANFPVGEHDDVVDAFCHALKAFTVERSIHTPDLHVRPGRLLSEWEEQEQTLRETLEWRAATSISPELDSSDGVGGDW